MAVKFAVSDVEREKTALRTENLKPFFDNMIREQSFKPSWDDKDNRKAKAACLPTEACSDPEEKVVHTDMHPFFGAIHMAFEDHYPLVLSPDMIWLMITQGVGTHLSLYPEECRKHFVKHDGKLLVKIDRDAFVMGKEDNDWESVFSDFSDKIEEHIGRENMEAFVQVFSTTGLTEKAAFQVALMDAMKHYFNWLLSTKCGIPEITLQGVTEDWERIRDSLQSLDRLGLEWWTKKLVPILDEFICASRYEVDKSFWQDIYKLDEESGGPNITGWSTTFLPYLKNGEQPVKNWLIVPSDDKYLRHSKHITNSNLTSGLSRCPFVWEYYGVDFDYELISGFFGVTQGESGALRPKIGWAVRRVDLEGKPVSAKDRKARAKA